MFAGNYGAGQGNDFAAAPRLITGKPKFKDPYGGNDEYFPQNIAYDRRVMRGSTYAAMVIPAGTNPDAMSMEKSMPRKKSTLRKMAVPGQKRKAVYPNRDIPSPEPVPGRRHMDIQTVEYKEMLTDKPPEQAVGCATEFYMDRPPVPFFQPKMPDPQNCKETQIDEGDAELFDFNAEVEPMLNVLCSKTLEQARMEVLEETELEIIRTQQKEYEEKVNAELIIAQRYEAAEKRKKEEVSRRKIQDKARKEERKAAHMKLNARMLAKVHLTGLREQALNELSTAGVLVKPLDRALHTEVVPWLMNQVMDYLKEDEAINAGAETVVIDGFTAAKQEHTDTMRRREEAKKKAEEDKIEAERQNEIRKQQRRVAREKKKKDEALEKWKDQVRSKIVFNGEVAEVREKNVVDANAHFKREQVIPTLGGHLLQIWYSLDAIDKAHPNGLKEYLQKKVEAGAADDADDDYFLRPNVIRELLVKDHLRIFFMQYLKDLQCEAIEILVHPTVVSYLKSVECPLDNIDALDEDQFQKFQELFMQNIVSPFHKGRGEHMSSLMEFATEILGKHVPVENVNVKADSIVDKIKLVEIPEGTYHEDWVETVTITNEDGSKTEEKHERTKNTGEGGVLILRVPQKEAGEEIPIEVTGKSNDGEKDKEAPKEEQKEDAAPRMVDEDQQFKAVMIQVRDVTGMKDAPSSYYAINEYAGKLIREDFLDFINKQYPEFFEDNDELQKIQLAINKSAVDEQEKFIKDNCDEYTYPCMVFEETAIDL